MTGANSHVATAIRTAVVLVLAWLVVAATRSSSGIAEISSRTWTFLILSGVTTGLSWLCYFRALQIGPASKVAPVDKLSLVFVVLLAAAFLGERISLSTGLGVAFVTLGVVILALS